MTLQDLQALHKLGLFNLAGIARIIGVDPPTLSARIRRNSPELSVKESDAIEAAFVGGFKVVGANLEMRGQTLQGHKLGVGGMVQLFNTGIIDFDVEVTLLVHGMIVYGPLISAGDYHLRHGSRFASAMQLSNKDEYMDQMRAIKESIEMQTDEQLKDPEREGNPEVNHVHFDHATILAGETSITINSPLRVWLGSIDGFSLGRPEHLDT